MESKSLNNQRKDQIIQQIKVQIQLMKHLINIAKSCLKFPRVMFWCQSKWAEDLCMTKLSPDILLNGWLQADLVKVYWSA